jgi:serine/threonine protein kinase
LGACAWGGTPGYEERFRREAHAAARLTEPHIIPIYDTGEIDGRLYLVMPIIDGVDVHSVLQREGPLSPTRAVGVIEQLAAALNVAHNHGLVHRDVKPSNALMTGDEFVYLIVRHRPRCFGDQTDADRLDHRHLRVHGPGALCDRHRRRPRPTSMRWRVCCTNA